MVKIYYESETGADVITPMTIAHALTKDECLKLEDLSSIADHLRIYVREQQMKDRKKWLNGNEEACPDEDHI